MDNESVCYKTFFELQNEASIDAMKEAYKTACEDGNEESAAIFARKIRNELLADSDKEITLDRLGLAVPTGTSFTAWLTFLKTLGEALTGEWATYRQALRDLPKQEGFPLDITFPTKPGEE